MANYFLKNTGGTVTKMYRVSYSTDGGGIKVTGASCTGAGITLPDGTPLSGIDEVVSSEQVLVDLALGNVVVGTVAEYGTLVAALITSQWG